jgi:hypothetical protein
MQIPKGFGWFSYTRAPDRRVGDQTIPRSPGDPPFVAWQAGATTWIVDDDVSNQHVRVDGITEDEIRLAFAFAQAMGWVVPGSDVAFRGAPPPSTDAVETDS